ncbi:glutathione S-transferase [Rhodovibrio sodomensis]|uniref:Glutathione S-transferase n=1 Tax=Rhodovibrio sodomensis TaxID=1088 RepID=A0ABS1DBR7_9PROT|nr:glutathione S-transferase N-terminal domain-containing protein [Rhodovibrio sodomensis]MBK1667163.1 glutathione S-transferase [Rhodovibrio sodomensis]
MTIDLYTWTTPNGRKVSIMLEECGLDYTVHPVNIGEGEQFEPGFLKISPNNRIPAIVDPDGPAGADGGPFALFESGAILIYLAEKTGLFWPGDPLGRYRTVEWLMWQMGGFGPMLGQAHHFRRFAKENVPYGIERYTNETRRLYGVLDKRLAEVPYLAGASYTIADMATFPWAQRHEWHGVDLAEFPNVERWYAELADRPAVRAGMDVPKR